MPRSTTTRTERPGRTEEKHRAWQAHCDRGGDCRQPNGPPLSGPLDQHVAGGAIERQEGPQSDRQNERLHKERNNQYRCAIQSAGKCAKIDKETLHEHFLKVQLKHDDSLCGRWLGFQATAIGLGTTCWPSCRASLWRRLCLVSSTFASY